jgi:hypothetical protein
MNTADLGKNLALIEEKWHTYFPGFSFNIAFWMTVSTTNTRQTSSLVKSLAYLPVWPYSSLVWAFLVYPLTSLSKGAKKSVSEKCWGLP